MRWRWWCCADQLCSDINGLYARRRPEAEAQARALLAANLVAPASSTPTAAKTEGGAFAPPQKTSFGPVPCLTGCVRRQASALYTYICTSTLCRQVRGLEFWGL